jgi:hypothetical protein
MAEITRKRTGELLRGVFQILSGEPDDAVNLNPAIEQGSNRQVIFL